MSKETKLYTEEELQSVVREIVGKEFKYLRKRIERVEQLVLKSNTDCGTVGEEDEVLKKG